VGVRTRQVTRLCSHSFLPAEPAYTSAWIITCILLPCKGLDYKGRLGLRVAQGAPSGYLDGSVLDVTSPVLQAPYPHPVE
jgi:hypothetical protein